MAQGYLGKISAIVSANTGDYVRKLNESAGVTRSFAKTIEQTLTSASREATKSLQGIYTPLQQFERALRAAASQKLSFKGFDGAIQTVEQLKQRLATIRSEDVDIVVRASGLKTLTDLRVAINDISSRDLDLFRNVGGLEGLKRLRAEIESTRDAAGNLTVKPRVDPTQIDRLIETFSVIDDRQITATIQVLGERELDNTLLRMRQMRDISDDILKPLAATRAKFGELSQEVQAGFIPALGRAQGAAEALTADLEGAARVGQDRFRSLEAQVVRTTEATDRLAEASRMASAGPRGTELAFAAPRVRDALAASADVRQRAAAAPAFALEGGTVASDVQKLVSIDNLIQRRRSEIESGTILNIDTTQARASLENLLVVARRVREQITAAIGGPDGETSTLINRARAQQDYYDESRRLSQQAAADAAAPLINRARAEQDYYEESTRLSQQAASDEAALLARRANAQRDFFEERARLEQQAAADAAAPLINRARAQREFEEETRRRDAVAADDAASAVAPAINRARAQRDASLDFGLDVDAPVRQIGVLESSIVSLKGKIDTLPVGLRSQFAPAVLEAQQNLERLAALPAATADELARAAAEVERLSASASRASALLGSFGGFGVEGINLGLDGRVVAGYTAQLNVLQGVIAGVAGEARGPLAAAFDSVRTTINAAMSDGTIATRSVQNSIEATIQSLARMSATASNQSIGRVLQQVAQAGDIGRRGLDRFALAAQQAGFAIDDFFSVTGGFEQRIRAVSNNITQLAFIIGSTKGLFIGLAVVLGTQVVLALTKWANSGRTAADETKALNDALTRQKSIVESLAEAFRALGDALRRGTLSPQAEDTRAFTESLKKARQEREKLNEESILNSDPVTRRERANQARIEREIQQAGDNGTLVGLQAQLEQSRRRERARRGVLVQPAPDANEVEQAIRRRAPNPFRRAVPNLPEGGDLASLRARRESLQGPLDRLQQILAEGPGFFGEGGPSFSIASASFDELSSLAARLDAAISDAVDGIATDLAGAARAPAASIRSAQQDVAKAIEAGIPGARDLRVLVDDVGVQFGNAIQALEQAVVIQDPAEREKAVADARRQLDQATSRRKEVETRADAVRREQTLNPERQIDAVVSRTQSLIDGIGQPAAALQSRLRELEFQRGTVQRQLEATPADPVLIQAEQQLNESIRALEKEVAQLDETFNGFDARERNRLRGDPERGRTLSMTPAERAAEQAQQGINDILSRFGEIAENTTGLVDQNGLNTAATRFLDDQMRQAAPLVYGMQDARQNALLQGPSKAALGAVDATTMEGQRELNRLLRGDDPAKDVNLIELRKQTEILRKIEEKAPIPVAG
jgi:hypothetical protein